MLNMGTSPPRGVKESCIEFTAPHEASVVTVANKAELKIPKRTSLPSILPAAWSTPRAASRGLPEDSAPQQISAPTRNSRNMAAHTDQPCLWFLSLIHISEPTRRTPISYAVF